VNVIRKDAQISPVGPADEFPGRFEVVLSAPTLDRDGDTLRPEDWKQPLPDHITFDQDHAMTVAGTVGSGVPTIDKDGRLIVAGTYSSLPRAQEVRTLVNEGHIRTTSVAFMTEKSTKDGVTRTRRELLNGAFVAIPSNRDALVLSSKSGARNSAADAEKIQGIHDHATALGADCAAAKGYGRKDGVVEAEPDPGQLAQSVDAAIDAALVLLANTDLAGLPAEVQQAIALVQAADSAVDELMDALNVPDPDEAAEPADPNVPAAKAAAADESAAEAAEIQTRGALIRARLQYHTFSEG
jgi:hypothetical protein